MQRLETTSSGNEEQSRAAARNGKRQQDTAKAMSGAAVQSKGK